MGDKNSPSMTTAVRLFTGIEWSRGIDGLLLGLVLVFVAKRNLASYVGWQPPSITAAPVAIEGSVSLASNPVLFVGGAILTLPLRLFGTPQFVLDIVLVWVGGWIALLAPGWYWIAAPVLAGIRRLKPVRRLLGFLLANLL